LELLEQDSLQAGCTPVAEASASKHSRMYFNMFVFVLYRSSRSLWSREFCRSWQHSGDDQNVDRFRLGQR